MVEHDRKKNNIVVYNFPEDLDQTTERENFVKMCKVTTELNVNVQKCIGMTEKLIKQDPF